MKTTICHYDPKLIGKTACGLQNYDLASMHPSQVTCKTCLKFAEREYKRKETKPAQADDNSKEE